MESVSGLHSAQVRVQTFLHIIPKSREVIIHSGPTRIQELWRKNKLKDYSISIPISHNPSSDLPLRVCDSGKMIVKPLYITCAHAVSPNSEMLGLMNANSLILFQFGHLIWFKATTAQMWEAKVKIIGLSRKRPR